MRASFWTVGMLALLTGCGGDDGPVPVAGSPLPLPTPGASRWASIELDSNGDGLAESITRYSYDALGRRLSQTTWRAELGVATGQPVERQTWTYDQASRVLAQEVEDNIGLRRISANYGADGLLASTSVRWRGSASVRTTVYDWRGLRLERAVVEDALPVSYHIFYDAAGFPERLEIQSRDVISEVTRYQWRVDGGLLSTSHDLPDVGNLVIYRLMHDAAGRAVASEQTDDGFEVEARRFFYDARGRLDRIEVDQWPAGFGDADFSSDFTYRIRWEDEPCQPTYLPTLPPTFDRRITLEARSDGTSLGCAD